MRVRELIEKLQALDPEVQVVYPDERDEDGRPRMVNQILQVRMPYKPLNGGALTTVKVVYLNPPLKMFDHEDDSPTGYDDGRDGYEGGPSSAPGHSPPSPLPTGRRRPDASR